jgi:hypothetical protein
LICYKEELNLLEEGLITIQGKSFRTGSGSVEAFTDMAKKQFVKRSCFQQKDK